MRPWNAIAVVICVASCGSSSSTIEALLEWHQDEDEIVHCHTLKLPNRTGAEVERITVDFPRGSHHVHVYRSDTPEPDGVADCTAGIDWRRWSLVLAVQSDPMDWALPEGVTVELAPSQQLLVQVHWFNFTTGGIDPSIRIRFQAATKPGTRHLQSALALSQDVYLAPRELKSVAGFMPLPEGAELIALMGHFHGRGTAYSVDLQSFGGDIVRPKIYSEGDEDTLAFGRLDPANPVGAGQGLSYRCDFANPGNDVITWGPSVATQEHCNLAAYYILPVDPPAVRPFLQGDVGEVAAPARILVGKAQSFRVQLTAPAGPLGVMVMLRVDPPEAAEVAPMVLVPPWEDSVESGLVGSAPGTAQLSATTGATVVTAEVEVEAEVEVVP